MFDEILYTEYDNRNEAFDILKRIGTIFDSNHRLMVNEYYEILGKKPVPEEAYTYAWINIEAFMFGRNGDKYHIKALEPWQIVNTNQEDE